MGVTGLRPRGLRANLRRRYAARSPYNDACRQASRLRMGIMVFSLFRDGQPDHQAASAPLRIQLAEMLTFFSIANVRAT